MKYILLIALLISFPAHAQKVTVTVSAVVVSATNGTLDEEVDVEEPDRPENECHHYYDEETNTYQIDC